MSKQPKDFFNPAITTVYDFDKTPLHEEVSLMDEQWLKDFAPALERNTPQLYELGYHTKAIVNSIGPDALEISVYLTHRRFHEIKALLPRDRFVICVERPEYDIKPHIFVKGSWLTDLHLRNHSVFAIFDAIGVKAALAREEIASDKLASLRDALDQIANEQSSFALVSFADSVLVKTNYQLGQYDSPIQYSYEPESVIRLFPTIQAAYREVLGLGVYAVITQGVNLDADGSLLHVSRSHNHISLNSLGLPFVQMLAIGEAVNKAIHSKAHEPMDLYMDKSFYHSLAFDWGRFDKDARPKYEYAAPMDSATNYYFAESFDTISGALRAKDARDQ